MNGRHQQHQQQIVNRPQNQPRRIDPEAGIKKGHVSSLANLFARQSSSEELWKAPPQQVRRVTSDRQRPAQPKPQPRPPPPPQQALVAEPFPSLLPRSPSSTPPPSNLGYTPVGKPARIRVVQEAQNGDRFSPSADQLEPSNASTGDLYNSSSDLRQQRYVTKKTRYTSRTILENDSDPDGSKDSINEKRPQQLEQWTVYDTLPVNGADERRRQGELKRRKEKEEEEERAEQRRQQLQQKEEHEQRLRESRERRRREEEEGQLERQRQRDESERRRREAREAREEQHRREDEERRRELDRRRQLELEERERRMQEYERRRAAEEEAAAAKQRREVANKTPEIFRREEWTVYEHVPAAVAGQQQQQLGPVEHGWRENAPQEQQQQQQQHWESQYQQYASSDSVVGYRRYLEDAAPAERSGKSDDATGEEDRRRRRATDEENWRRRHEEDEHRRRRDEEARRWHREEEERRLRREENERHRHQEEEEQRRRRQVEERRRRRVEEDEQRRRHQEKEEQRRRQEEDERRRRREEKEKRHRWENEEAMRRRTTTRSERARTKTPEIFTKEQWTVYEKIPTYEETAVYETTSRHRRQEEALTGDSQDSVVGYRRLLDEAAGAPARRARSFERSSRRTDVAGGGGSSGQRPRRRSLGAENLSVDEWVVYHNVPHQQAEQLAARTTDRYDHLREFQERKEGEGVETRMSTPFRVEEWTVTQQIPLEEEATGYWASPSVATDWGRRESRAVRHEGQRPSAGEAAQRGVGYQSYYQSVGNRRWSHSSSENGGGSWSRRSPAARGYRGSPGPGRGTPWLDNGNVFHDSFSVSRDNPVYAVN